MKWSEGKSSRFQEPSNSSKISLWKLWKPEHCQLRRHVVYGLFLPMRRITTVKIYDFLPDSKIHTFAVFPLSLRFTVWWSTVETGKRLAVLVGVDFGPPLKPWEGTGDIIRTEKYGKLCGTQNIHIMQCTRQNPQLIVTAINKIPYADGCNHSRSHTCILFVKEIKQTDMNHLGKVTGTDWNLACKKLSLDDSDKFKHSRR